ncbi:MAG: S8 family serine peptidase [Anaerolineae bacterium]|nr:S8 family serine peptidase [Anaerolineae bacterium]
MRNAGGILFDYIPDFAFIVYMDASVLQHVTAIPEVIWIGLYEPAFKISSDLVGTEGDLDLNVQTFPNQAPEVLASHLSSVGASVQEVSQQSTGALFRLTSDASHIKDLAHIPGVRWIEPFYERVLFNDVARADAIMAAETIWNDLGLYGAGQIVAVSDTGLDTGSLATLHQDFRGDPIGCTGTNRVVAAYALGRTGDWSDSCYDATYGAEGGHGTHVAGSILGNGCQSGSTDLPDYSGSHAGLAPQAGLVFQSVMSSDCGLGGLPDDLNTLFSQAYAAGARIHSNSWGSSVSGQYTVDAYNTDLYSWNNKDYTILFSAGNSGIDADNDGVVDLDSMGAPGTAKNCITVGATENDRPYGGVNPEHTGDLWDEVQCSGNGGGAGWGNCWPADFPVDPILSDLLSDDTYGMAAFSSRGPTDDGRTKPDIVAPGTNILSTKSQATYVSSGWGDGENQYYQFMGGTSMATPLTAGAVALIRDFYNDIEGIAVPSSALLKATLVNGATEVSPGQYAVPYTEQPTTRPNQVEGWGRVNLQESLLPTSPRVLHYVDFTEGLQTGEYDSDTFSMSATQPFRTTLAWTDYPGALAAAGGLVNDLDLDVTDALGTIHYPNNASQQGATEFLTYDTDPYYVVAVNASNQYAVRFTPTSYPVSVEEAVFLAYPSSTPVNYQVRIYDDDGTGGNPGTLLYGPITVGVSAAGWASLKIPSASRPVITSGGFYVSVQGSSTAADLTDDQTDNTTNSFYYHKLTGNNYGWGQWTGNDLNIRASVVGSDYVTPYDRINNLIGVDINTPAQTGNYTVKVAAYNVPQGPQPYALVTSGAVTLTGAQSYRIFAGGDTDPRTFGRTGVQIDFSSGPAGNVTVTMDKSASSHPAPPGGLSLALNWNVSSAMSGFTAQLVLHYDESDLPTGMDETTISAYRWTGSAWEDKGSTVDAVANTITVADVTEFSDWGLFGDNPTAVTLAAFAAAPQDNAILVAWETASELDNAGFNLYRSETTEGPYTQLNAEIIPPQNPGMALGAVYTWPDVDVRPGAIYFYKLEDFDIYGGHAFHGPVWATASTAYHRVYLPVVLHP